MTNSNPTPSIEESLLHIAIRLDEMTGNAMGKSTLSITNESDYSEDIAAQLSNLNEKLDELNTNFSNLNDRLDAIETELSPLSTISETLDNFLGWYIEFNKNK